MKTYEIWMEGFAITGQRQEASFIGTGKGETFDSAIRDFIHNNPKIGIEQRGEYWSIWGCRLFDNEKDARKSFG